MLYNIIGGSMSDNSDKIKESNNLENNNVDIKLNNKKKIIIVSIISIFVILGVISLLFFPKINLNGKSYVKVTLNDVYTEKGAKVTISGKDISSNVKIKGSVDTSKPGKYEVVYTIKKGFITQ